MKTLFTSLVLLLSIFLHAEFDTRTYASIEFSELNSKIVWKTTGTRPEGDSCIIRVKTLVPVLKGNQTLLQRKVFEYKYFFKNGQELSFILNDPASFNNLQKNKSQAIAQASIAGQSLFTISGSIERGSADILYNNLMYAKPFGHNEYGGMDYDRPSVEIFYRVQTMPATFTDIRYWSEDKTVYVQWTAANEKDVDQYFLLKLDKSGEYVKIDSVRAANTGTLTHYVGFDRNPDAENIYMVRGEDVNYLKFETEPFSVDVDMPDPVVLISPNPGAEYMNVDIPTFSSSQPSIVKVINIDGRAVMEQPIPEDQPKVDISSLEPGVYSIYIDNIFVQRFVKN